jgi:hypothetical protein
VSHLRPQAPQLVTDASAVSQPSVSGRVVSQSAHPSAQRAKAHVLPLQVAPALCAVSQASPHPEQFEGVLSEVSQPSVSGGAVSQLAHPATQLAYAQVVPVQLSPTLWVVSQATPQAPQFRTDTVSPQSSSASSLPRASPRSAASVKVPVPARASAVAVASAASATSPVAAALPSTLPSTSE